MTNMMTYEGVLFLFRGGVEELASDRGKGRQLDSRVDSGWRTYRCRLGMELLERFIRYALEAFGVVTGSIALHIQNGTLYLVYPRGLC